MFRSIIPLAETEIVLGLHQDGEPLQQPVYDLGNTCKLVHNHLPQFCEILRSGLLLLQSLLLSICDTLHHCGPVYLVLSSSLLIL